MAKTKPDPGADYRAAKQAVTDHLRVLATAELAVVEWLRALGSPVAAIEAAAAPTHPEHLALLAAVQRAEVDVAWCRALVVACGEVVKGCKFETVPNDRAALRHPVEIVEGT